VIMNIIFAAILWGGIPFLLLLSGELIRGISRASHNVLSGIAEAYCYSIPFVQLVDSMEITGNGIGNLRQSNWSRGSNAIFPTVYMLISVICYSAVGLFFAWRAKKRFRKKIF
jgi:hypothetical protein